MGLHEAARKYNVPTETLRGCNAGLISLDCRPGHCTVLTNEEEACMVGGIFLVDLRNLVSTLSTLVK